MPIPFDI